MSIQNLIKFGERKSSEIFSEIAKQAAEEIKSNANVNKSTQLRKFYDELAMWNERVQLAQADKLAKFNELEPFIKMLKAKVAYAKGRKHIDDKFMAIFNQTIDEIKCPQTLKEAKLFMEAVMGYCKFYEKN
ncbi:type III-A CRISPR-associated protein Csm2 [Actinobacillus porcinus]|uniref:type III-A CRISPR-associated protein Csm2 n=1 Tax=Actinobacillus porcinus TaxID=51048 RepID=UPI0023551AF0|nr:type III-A CRISPR-associated protein Csm2 [Actinobacillus porcinus]